MSEPLKHVHKVIKLPLIPHRLFEETCSFQFDNPLMYYRTAYRLF